MIYISLILKAKNGVDILQKEMHQDLVICILQMQSIEKFMFFEEAMGKII